MRAGELSGVGHRWPVVFLVAVLPYLGIAQPVVAPLGADCERGLATHGVPLAGVGNAAAVDVAGPVTFNTVSTGLQHTLALDEGGRAWAWGHGWRGQLGDGSTTDRATPVSVTMPDGSWFTSISAGASHSLALDQYGQAWAWGEGGAGQLGDGYTTDRLVPTRVHMPQGRFFERISAGAEHSLALDQHGQVWSWGRGPNASEEIQVEPGRVQMRHGVAYCEISAGSKHSLALDRHGRVWSWSVGPLRDAPPTLVPALPGVTFAQISAGWQRSVALDLEGNAWTWAHDSLDAPGRVDGLEGIRFHQIAAGSSHMVGLDTDHQAVWLWDHDEGATLGDHASAVGRSPTIVQAPSGVRFAMIGSGAGHVVALDQGGQAWAWGIGQSGQLGNASMCDRSTPSLVHMPIDLLLVTASSSRGHSLAVDPSGGVWAWGSNTFGQLGVGDTCDRVAPTRVSAPDGIAFVQVSAGPTYSLALDGNGDAWWWGSGLLGALDDVAAAHAPAPLARPGEAAFTQVAAGHGFALALDGLGRVWAWGHQGHSALDGTTSRRDEPTAVTMPTGTTFTQITAGVYHSHALDQRGHAWGWGFGAAGALGNGDQIDRFRPTRVTMPNSLSFKQIAAGDGYSLAIDEDGRAWTWGRGDFAGLADGGTRYYYVPTRVAMDDNLVLTHIVAGSSHSLALDSFGRVLAWGPPRSRQLGVPEEATWHPTPTAVPLPTGAVVKQVSGGWSHSLAVDQDGYVWGWGSAARGRLGDGVISDRGATRWTAPVRSAVR